MRIHRLFVLAVASSAAFAQQTTLAPQRDRITDAAIQADHDAYASIQRRIRALNDGGRRVADYHLAKAQCWLDTSFHEYTRNDRSAYPQEALAESERLVVAMETGREPLPMDTPLVNGASRVRPDLWARLDALKAAGPFRCAQQRIACAEVELVHAGNELDQQGWRHAKPYVQIAEDLVAEAGALAERCAPPSAPPPTAGTPPREDAVVVRVVFAFDRGDAGGIVPSSRDALDALMRRLPDERVRSIRVAGHADRLNGTRDASYNRRLAERRAATVRDLLVAHGVAPALVTVAAEGDAHPVAACGGRFASRAALEACLAPDRRVDVEVRVEVAPTK